MPAEMGIFKVCLILKRCWPTLFNIIPIVCTYPLIAEIFTLYTFCSTCKSGIRDRRVRDRRLQNQSSRWWKNILIISGEMYICIHFCKSLPNIPSFTTSNFNSIFPSKSTKSYSVKYCIYHKPKTPQEWHVIGMQFLLDPGRKKKFHLCCRKKGSVIIIRSTMLAAQA